MCYSSMLRLFVTREPTNEHFFSVPENWKMRGSPIIYRVMYGCQPANTLSSLSTQLS